MKLLGLIGGTSYHSTLEYYRTINKKVGEKLGGGQNPELLLYSINMDIMRRQDKDEINKKYLEVAQALERAGAEALMICANTPHMAVEFVKSKIGIPFLHIADSVGEEAKRKDYKRLLLLGNRPTITIGFIKNYLANQHNLEVFTPDEKSIDRSHYFVSNELTRGIFSAEAKSFYKELINSYENKVDAVILGCTELPILLKEEKANLPFISTTDLHIQTAVDFILD